MYINVHTQVSFVGAQYSKATSEVLFIYAPLALFCGQFIDILFDFW